MNRRLQQFLAAENISQSQFADTLGVARASVSHILAGRNKPGFDFIESMSRNYPDINLEWIITGKGKMYKSAAPKTEKTSVPDDLFSSFDEEQLAMQSDNSFTTNNIAIQHISSPKPASTKPESPVNATSASNGEFAQRSQRKESLPLASNIQAIDNQRNIVKIIVFYDDNTYQELK